MDSAKTVTYIEYRDTESGRVSVVPQRPPYTTWSGKIECPVNTQVGKRLLANGGQAVKMSATHEGKRLMKEGHKTDDDWVSGLWTAPVNWMEEMAPEN